MSRKVDLEKSIFDSYGIIREYEDILRLSDNPKEKARARRAIEEQQEFVKGYLEEYASLCGKLARPMPENIAEVAAAYGISLPPTSSSQSKSLDFGKI
jgi:hypothetical protein